MSENSGKDGKATTPEAKPVKVVGAAPKASESSAPRSSTTPGAARPAKAAPAAGAVAPPAAAAKKAAPAAAAAAKKAAPATRPTPTVGAAAPTKAPATKAPATKAPAAKAPAAKAPAPATAAPKVAAQAAAAPAPAAAGVEDTAVRPGFGDRLKGRLDQASAKAEAAAEKARTKREERRESAAPAASVSVGSAIASGGERRPGRSPRHARLRLSRIDPWSTARVAFLLSVAMGIVLFVAVAIIWTVLGAAGVWDAVDSVIASVASAADGSSAFRAEDYVGTGRVLGLTLVVSVVNVVLLTAMATLGAYLYNMAAALLGGIEVTLSEDND